MKYLTHSVVALVFVSLAVAPLGAHAQVPSTPTIAALEAQIALLRAEIASRKFVNAAATTTSESDVEITKVTTTKKPTISGTAEDTSRLYVTVTKEGSTKASFTKSVKVSKDKWKTRVTRNLSDGTYEIEVLDKKGGEVLVTKTLTIGKKTSTSSSVSSSGSFSVSLVPLLMGGTARANQAVAVSYLKVVNTGKETGTLTGVTLTQKGSAPASAVASLTIKDDKDGSQGQASVSGLTTTVPTTSVFAPGQMKLFTIKAVLAGNTMSHLGKTLMYDVTGVTGSKSGFPIKGTTWVIGL